MHTHTVHIHTQIYIYHIYVYVYIYIYLAEMHSDPMSVDYTIIVGEHITPAWWSLCATMIAETALNTPIFAVVFSASEAEGPHKRLQGDMGFPYRTWKENKSFDGEVWFAWLSPLSLRINRNFKYQERKCMAEACREPHLGLKWGWWRNRASSQHCSKTNLEDEGMNSGKR